MSDFGQDEKTVQRSIATPGAALAGAGGASPAEAMHETRKNVTRHRRAAMRKGEGNAESKVDIPEGGGKQLDGGVKHAMEKKLGADLSGVQIHTGGASAQASEQLNARAFTVGNDVHFNAGQFDPGSKEGTKLLAHELTHVVQGQKGGVQTKKEVEGEEADAEGKDGESLEVSDPEEPAEQEADAVADQATAEMGEGGVADEAKAAGGGDGDEAGEGVDAGGGKKAMEAEGGAAKSETEEAAPEAATKLKSPISAKLNASALRKLLRKTAYRDEAPAEEKPAEAEAAAAPAQGEEKQAEDAPAETAGAESAAAPDAAAAEGESKQSAESEEAKPAESEEAAPSQSVAAKLKGVHRKVFRYPAEYEANMQQWKDMECAKANGATTPAAIGAVLGGLDSTFADNTAVAGQMVGKLNTAMSEAQAAWAAEDAAKPTEPPKAPQKKRDFIDSRLTKLAATAPNAIKSTINSATPDKKCDVKDAFWKMCSADWSICAPEEDATPELMNGIGGVYKAFDAGDFYSKMDPKLARVWEASGGAAAWMAGVNGGQALPVAPPGKESHPDVAPFATGAKPAFPGTVSGFISTAKALDDPKVISADKATVLKLLGLQEGRYKSPKMILSKMGAAGAAAGTAGGAKLGKPSMFYLMAFPENIYKAENRQHGETSGGEPELQTVDMPAQAFLDGLPMVKT